MQAETQQSQKEWDEILATECHPTLQAGIVIAHEMICKRREHSRMAELQGLAIMLDFLGKGDTKVSFYVQIMEGALMALNPGSIDHADEILRDCIRTLLKKNHDYGASVFNAGPLTPNLSPETAALVRLGDKYNRLKTLLTAEAQVNETKRETIVDVIGYSIILAGMAAQQAEVSCRLRKAMTGE